MTNSIVQAIIFVGLFLGLSYTDRLVKAKWGFVGGIWLARLVYASCLMVTMYGYDPASICDKVILWVVGVLFIGNMVVYNPWVISEIALQRSKENDEGQDQG